MFIHVVTLYYMSFSSLSFYCWLVILFCYSTVHIWYLNQSCIDIYTNTSLHFIMECNWLFGKICSNSSVVTVPQPKINMFHGLMYANFVLTIFSFVPLVGASFLFLDLVMLQCGSDVLFTQQSNDKSSYSYIWLHGPLSPTISSTKKCNRNQQKSKSEVGNETIREAASMYMSFAWVASENR